MSDLRSQLARAFDLPVPEEPSSDSAPNSDDPLSASAHLSTPWIDALHDVVRDLDGLRVPRSPSFQASRQLHDRAVKRLKAAGRQRDARALDEARSRYVKRREKLAWTRLKARFGELGLSQKVYRSVKQGKVEPERALACLAAIGEVGLRGMAAAELRKRLTKS